LSRLGRFDEAIEHYKQASVLKPENSQIHYKLGESCAALGRMEQALKSWKKSVELGNEQPLAFNNIAWVLAVYPEKPFFNPTEAVELAEKACRLTDFQNPEFLDTLAVCYGAAGRFDEAATTIEKAIDSAAASNEPELVEKYQKRLVLYKANQPYRQSTNAANGKAMK